MSAADSTSREDLLVSSGFCVSRTRRWTSQNAALAARVEQLEGENQQLRARVVELERRVSRNSNLPPSTDVFGRPKAEPKPGSGRGRGKQKGAPGVTDEHVTMAAEAAGITADIEHMPMKYDTLLGPASAGLSGGQRQRVALVQALVWNSRLLPGRGDKCAGPGLGEAGVRQPAGPRLHAHRHCTPAEHGRRTGPYRGLIGAS